MSTVTEVKTTWRQLTFMKRKPGTTLEHFQKHWSTTHVQVVTALPIFREKVFRYEQLYPQEGLGNSILDMPGAPEGEGWDGIVVLDFRCKADWEALVNNAEYQKAGLADVALFTDIPKATRVFVRRELQFTS